MPRVAWIRCRNLPEPDLDEAPGLAALGAAGLDPAPIGWDDPAAPDLGAFDLAVLRAPWNYYEDPKGFLDWIEAASRKTRVVNGPAVVRWNLHKSYLTRLEERGVPVVPTAFVGRGASVDLAGLLADRGWDEVVVKPAVSASSFCTKRFGSGELEAGAAFLAGALAERDMMVQRYVPSVATDGETCLVWIDGEPTHAVVKAPRFAGDEEDVSVAESIDPDLAALAEASLDVACDDGGFGREELLYARVDTVLLDGAQVISELELLEPSLYFPASPAALDRFVRAVARRAGPAGA